MSDEIDDAELVEKWSSRELADRIAENNPDQDGFVLRVLAARIAVRADACRDPLHLMKDFSRTLASLADATRTIIPRSVGDHLDDPDAAATYSLALDNLTGASASLRDLHNWF